VSGVLDIGTARVAAYFLETGVLSMVAVVLLVNCRMRRDGSAQSTDLKGNNISRGLVRF
jgi:hypothetical protein